MSEDILDVLSGLTSAKKLLITGHSLVEENERKAA